MGRSWAIRAAERILYPDGNPLQGYDGEDVKEVAKIILEEFLGRDAACNECGELKEFCICGSEGWRAAGSTSN